MSNDTPNKRPFEELSSSQSVAGAREIRPASIAGEESEGAKLGAIVIEPVKVFARTVTTTQLEPPT